MSKTIGIALTAILTFAIASHYLSFIDFKELLCKEDTKKAVGLEWAEAFNISDPIQFKMDTDSNSRQGNYIYTIDINGMDTKDDLLAIGETVMDYMKMAGIQTITFKVSLDDKLKEKNE